MAGQGAILFSVKPDSHIVSKAVTIFIVIAGTSCSVSHAPYATATALEPPALILRTLVPAASPTLPPFLFPMLPITPYPKAQAVSNNSVAFVAGDPQHQTLTSSLWIANIDGSGERELVEDVDTSDWQRAATELKWSPNGKWISYMSAADLWLTAPDGTINKR